MLSWVERIPLERAMALAIGLALLIMQGPLVAYSVFGSLREIEHQARSQAETALASLRGAHLQTMLNRRLIDSGELSLSSQDAVLSQIVRADHDLDIWIFTSPDRFRLGLRSSPDVSGPRDDLDRAAIEVGQPVEALREGILRIVRPIMLDGGPGQDPRCVSCHARTTGSTGTVIGGYGVAIDLRSELTQWRRTALRQAVSAILVIILTVALIASLLHVTVLRPLRRLTEATLRLANDEACVAIEGRNRPDELGALARSLLVFRESLSARQRLERAEAAARSEARYLASHDVLTGLANRIQLADRLEHALSIARTNSIRAAVLSVDIDGFKEVNDTHGHAAGDELLKKIAMWLRKSVRDIDTVARIGSDEFAIVQVGLFGPNDVQALCARLIGRFDEPWQIQGQNLLISACIGVSIGPDDGDAAEILVRQAELALSEAKTAGRCTFRFFVPAMNELHAARQALERDLKRAVAEGQLRLHYQPCFDLRTGRIASVEALMRWTDPVRGVVSPSEFVPVAEATGLIVQIGHWALRSACKDAARWPDVLMAVNLSPVQFRHPDLVGLVHAVLQETGLPSSRLELEITEGVLLDDVEGAARTLDDLKELGVRVAMDDFGTGYSSLGYLQRFPFDKLKIDQSFVRNLGQDRYAAAIVCSVIGLGRSLGMTVTAEGVETSVQLSFLERQGCDQAQGYFLGHPMPKEDIAQLIHGEPLPHPVAPRPGRQAALQVQAC